MIYLQLLWSFFKIGMFSFGGGYAMIPLIQKEILSLGWVEPREFADIVALSQMTPGPIAVNAATYIGAKAAGITGAAFATLGVSLPSFILIVAIAKFITKFKESQIIESVLKGVRPVTMGLVSSAVIFFASMSIFTADLSFSSIKNFFTGKLPAAAQGIQIHPGALLIFLIILVAVKKFKMHPILAVISSAVLGIFLT